MNTKMLKKFVWLWLALLLPLGFVACSDDDEPLKDIPEVITPDGDDDPYLTEEGYYNVVEPYINQFAFAEISQYYLWIKEVESDMENWYLNEDPVEKVKSIRYKENGEDVDKWTQVMSDIDTMMGDIDGENAVGTYGFDFLLYYLDEARTTFVAVVTMVYPDSSAEEAGLHRGSVILKINGESITKDNYMALYNPSSFTLSVADSREQMDSPKEISLVSKVMELETVLYEKTFDCNGKKVGYLCFMEFTMTSCERLIEVCRKFKQEGVKELILDLRYNGGGEGFVMEVLGSMLVPEAHVTGKDIFYKEKYNESVTAAYQEYYGEDFMNSYFSNKQEATFEWVDENGNKQSKTYSFDLSNANVGLNKIYALVSDNSASASEVLLLGLMPYMDIELIGTQTYGKYCGGYVFSANKWYTGEEEIVELLKSKNPDAYQQYYDEYWKYFSGWKNYVGKWGLYVMASSVTDANDENPYNPKGFPPHVEVEDDPRETYPLGDEREALLNAALMRAGKTDLASRVSSRSVGVFLEKSDIRISNSPLDGKLIYTDDRLKSAFQGKKRRIGLLD